MLEDAGLIIRIIVTGFLLVVFAYAIVRGASFAFFRSKLEHRRTVTKEMREGNKSDGV